MHWACMLLLFQYTLLSCLLLSGVHLRRALCDALERRASARHAAAEGYGGLRDHPTEAVPCGCSALSFRSLSSLNSHAALAACCLHADSHATRGLQFDFHACVTLEACSVLPPLSVLGHLRVACHLCRVCSCALIST